MDFYGWKIKTWNFNDKNLQEQREKMTNWCKKNANKYQINEIFVNNAYAVEYRLLLK